MPIGGYAVEANIPVEKMRADCEKRVCGGKAGWESGCGVSRGGGAVLDFDGVDFVELLSLMLPASGARSRSEGEWGQGRGRYEIASRHCMM